MGKGSWTSRAAVAAAAQAVAFVGASSLSADIRFDGEASRVTIRHDPDRSSTSIAPVVKTLTLVPSSADLPLPPSYQLRKTFTSGDASSRAFGSIGHLTSATQATFVLVPGTGVTQVDPGDAAYPGASSLKFGVDLVWEVGSAGFGPLATGYGSIAVGGTVGVGGSARFLANLSFADAVTGQKLRSDWVEDFAFRDPGAFRRTFTTSRVFNEDGAGTFGVLQPGQKLRINGFVEFRSSNAETPTNIDPLSLEFGGAPPTATYGRNLFFGAWSDPQFWADPEPGNTGLLDVPDGVGHRARFDAGVSSNGVIVDGVRTVGSLEFIGLTGYSCEGVTLRMQSQNGPATILVALPQTGQGGYFVDPTIELASPTDVHVDAGASLVLSSRGTKITGPNGITKFGEGELTLDGFGNDYAGGTQIYEGVVRGLTDSFGTGAVIVHGGKLVYRVGQTAGAVTVDVRSGAEVALDYEQFLPEQVEAFRGERFVVARHGGIQVDGNTGPTLTIGANLMLETGAMISSGCVGCGLFTQMEDVPRFIAGAAGEGSVFEGLPVGSRATSPWLGIGSGRGNNAIKRSEFFGGSIQVFGDAEVLVHRGGSLSIEAPIDSGDAGARSLMKYGAGEAVIAGFGNFDGPVTVAEGSLIVNGQLRSRVNVLPGALVGGTNWIHGHVELSSDSNGNGARLAPGGATGTNPGPFFTVGSLTLSQSSQLDFDLGFVAGSSDRLRVERDLVLDGFLNVNGMEHFGPGSYELVQYGGRVTDNGLEIGRVTDAYGYELTVVQNATGGGKVVLAVDVPHWKGDDLSAWDSGANWFGGRVPNAPGAIAEFRGAIGESGVRNVLLLADQTVGSVTFDSDRSYQINPRRDDWLFIDNRGMGATITSTRGSHVVGATLVVKDHLEAAVETDSVLHAAGGMSVAADKKVIKLGGGALRITNGLAMASTAVFEVEQGTLEIDSMRGGRLGVLRGAEVKVKGQGSARPTLVLDGLTFEEDAEAAEGPFGKIDLGGGQLVVRATAATRAAVLEQITSYVRSARNGTSGRWRGDGLTSSLAFSFPLTGLAAMVNPGLAQLGGAPVSPDDVIVIYTYNGDANLDGRVNADDYFRIDQGFLAQRADPTYRDGDFNYDGTVNADDYFLIDQAFLGQGEPLGGTAAMAAVAVPEPSIGGMLCVGGLLIRRRRRR